MAKYLSLKQGILKDYNTPDERTMRVLGIVKLTESQVEAFNSMDAKQRSTFIEEMSNGNNSQAIEQKKRTTVENVDKIITATQPETETIEEMPNEFNKVYEIEEMEDSQEPKKRGRKPKSI